MNTQALPGERVLVLQASRYYLRPDLFLCSTQPDEYRVLQELSYKDINAFWEEVYQQGYTYIAYQQTYTTKHL